MAVWRTWAEAMREALYGPGGFYARGEAPAAHFRTSVHASGLFAAAVHRLADLAGLRTVVDVGAGGGELLAALHHLDPALALHGVDVRRRPDGLPAEVTWSAEVPPMPRALVVANEWLDNVPLDVVTQVDGEARLVLVDRDGTERAGPAPDPADAAWLDRWWPTGGRAEVGRGRDEAWAGVVGRLRRGVAVAVDYGHRRDTRPPAGTLTAYRHGRQVPPAPDGTRDVTAHVALDSCAAAGQAAGEETAPTATALLTQRDALRRLGVSAARPDRDLAARDPVAYLRGLERAGQAAELTDPGGLGGFGWIVHAVGVPMPFR